MATDFYLVPNDKNYNNFGVFESTLQMVCLVKQVEIDRINEHDFNLILHSNDQVGFAIDWISDHPYYWDENFDSKTEKPDGQIYIISTHGKSVPFTIDFMKLFLIELKKNGLLFDFYDPQQSRYLMRWVKDKK